MNKSIKFYTIFYEIGGNVKKIIIYVKVYAQNLCQICVINQKY